MKPEAPRLPRPSILVAALALLAILPFAASLGGWFIYDDFVLIIHNDAVREFRLKELWTSEFFADANGPRLHYFRPLVSTTFAIDWALFGGNASGFHATNLILHAIVTVLVYRTLARWSGREAVAFLGALVWAWHPSKVEAVAWISGRTDILCTVGLLLAAAGSARRFRGLRHGLPLEIVGAFIAFSSKEGAVILPGLIAVEAWVAEGRPHPDFNAIGRSVFRAVPHAALGVAYLIARSLTLPLSSGEGNAAHRASAALLFVETCGEMAKTLALPWPLALHRAPIEIDETGRLIHDPLRLGLGALAIVGLIAATAFFLKRRPLAAAGLLLGALLALPTANLRPTGMPFLFSERFLYLPTLGLALALVELAPKRWNFRGKITAGGTFLAVVALAIVSLFHTSHFESERSFWRHELSVQPDLSVAIEPVFNQTYRDGHYQEALALAVHGYRHADRWLFGRFFDLSFALNAARAKEALTPDDDAATLAKLAEFFRRFFLEKTTSILEVDSQVIVIDGRAPQARWLREDAPGGFGEFQAMGAQALARAGDCEGALVMARAARELIDALPGLRTTVFAFARCGAFDEAYELTAKLGEHSKARPGIEAELELLRTKAEARGN